MDWGSHSEKEMIIGKVIFEISLKNDVHNNYETDYRLYHLNQPTCYSPKTLHHPRRSFSDRKGYRVREHTNDGPSHPLHRPAGGAVAHAKCVPD